MADEAAPRTSWMAYDMPLGEELRLEAQIRDLAGHGDVAKVRELCASLMRQNYHQQQLLSRAVGRIGELEMIVLLGALAEPEETGVFLDMAAQLLEELGVT